MNIEIDANDLRVMNNNITHEHTFGGMHSLSNHISHNQIIEEEEEPNYPM